MPYELKTDDVYGLVSKLHADTKQKGDELFFTYCPYCHGGGHDKNTFSINLHTGQFNCFRSGCGKQGHFVQMARDFDYPLEFQNSPRRVYRSLPQRPVVIKEPAIEFMKSRGIGRETAERYFITTQKQKDNVIVFPFYDENNVLQFVKYRKADFKKGVDKCKEWCEENTKPILFGMGQCVDFETLVITEGQIDSLSVAECGIKNAVSVPTGARGFTWLDNCWDWVTKFKEVIVFGDCENGQITLVDELSKRLPIPVKVVQQADYLGEKDANDLLRKFGKGAVVEAVHNAKLLPIKQIEELADVKAVDIYGMEHIATKIPEIDRVLGGMFFGQVILLTGKRGEGKSTFMSQLILEALDQDYKTLVYSGELTDYHFKRWLDLQAAGNENLTEYTNPFGDIAYTISDETIAKINNWYRGKAYLYDNNAVDCDDEMESLLETIEKAICRYGIKLVCIDNLMTAMEVDPKLDLYRAQSVFVKKLKQIAVKYNVVVILVAHPRKTTGAVEDNDDVAGSSDITNRVDVVMAYSRSETQDCDSVLRVTKNRLTGRLILKDNAVKLFYSASSKRISSISTNTKKYGWELEPTQYDDMLPDLPF